MRARTLVRAGAALLTALLALAAALALLLSSERGSAWLLGRVPGLEVQGLQGALLGERLAADRIAWQGAAGRLELRGVAAEGLARRWLPAPGQWLALRAERVALRTLAWTPAPDAPPAAVPRSLRLPLALEAPLAIERIERPGGAPVEGLTARLAIGDDGGARHRVDGLALQWDRLRADGRATLAADAPFALDAALGLGSVDGAARPWRAALTLRGPLEAPRLAGRLRGQDDALAADLDAGLRPFAPWPLAELRLHTQALDLARLAGGWPETAVSGQAELRDRTAEAPFEARIALVNARPGRWDEGRLPVARAEASLSARPDARDRVQLESLVLELADAAAAAGRLSAQGQWQGQALAVQARLQGLVPQRLDGRAAAMRLDGALDLAARGLPSPDPSAAAERPPWGLDLRGTLDGRLDAAPVPVQLALDLGLEADGLALRTLRARSGDARAEASGRARREAGRWRLDGAWRLQAFDPVPWWPGPAGSAWRRGPHRLDGAGRLALTLPERAAPGLARWRQLAGTAEATLDGGSLLAGVPLRGQLRLAPAGQVDAELLLAGNRLGLQGQADAATEGRGDRWQLALQAPALDALAPLAALHPALAALPRAGRAEAQAALQGRWPDLRGSAQARATGLAATGWSLAEGAAEARFDGLDAPWSARLALTRLVAGGTPVPQLAATLQGTPADHRLEAEAVLPVGPPPLLAQALGLRTRGGTQLLWQASGGLRRAEAGWRWSGRSERLTLGAADGSTLARPAPRDWLDLGPLAAEAEWDAGGALQRLRVDAGRLRVGDALALAWDELRLDPGGWRARAELEGFQVAPLLARLQPGMDWQGDLRVGARLDLSAGERFDADLVFERQGGDLTVSDLAGARLALGLSDLRLALQAHDGTWYFTQALAGRALGEAGAALRVLTAPGRRWPEPEAPLDGTLQLRVANLGVWGAWVPPGWRLEGAVETKAQVGGRFGDPRLRGELVGQGLGARNLLQGVQVSDGELRVRLEGERATVERFRLAGGDGQLTVSGQATLGAEPQAQLALEAERFRVLGRVDRRLVASGRATLALAPQTLTLRGEVGVDEGLFDASRADAPSLDDDVTVRRPGDAEPSADEAAAAARRPRTTTVALDVDLGRKLRVRGRGLDTLLTGRLRVSAPGGRLALQGTVAAADGTYAAYGQRLEIERGLLAFSGPPDNPRLDVLALRPNLDIEVGVAVTGTAQAPRVRLHSNPELSDTDKLSWLVLGRDPSGLGRTDTALLQRAAVALLAGEGEAPTDALLRNLGLDEVSVRQSDGDARETIVTVGKQISRRWYVGYERGVNATVGTWQLIYRIAQRFTLRAQSGGENALDLIWVRRVP